jgi:hypothetical protein
MKRAIPFACGLMASGWAFGGLDTGPWRRAEGQGLVLDRILREGLRFRRDVGSCEVLIALLSGE